MNRAVIAACLTALVCSGTFSQKKSDESVVDRFLRYVKFDTESKDDVTATPTSTLEIALARKLVGELKALGLKDAVVDDNCFVFATLPGNLPKAELSKAPVIGLISHLDTSPEVTDAGVNPIVHSNYQGGDIVLPDDTLQVITAAKNPHLRDFVGGAIITAGGRTLLGADDKAGIAEIMTMLHALVADPSLHHGTLKIAFTPDEETGSGIAKFNVKKFGARYAYTVDGDRTGQINEESWSADQATVTIHGRSAHPGSAKGIMINSMYAAADFLLQLPDSLKPEATEGREGFLHPDHGTLGVEESTIKLILRDFDLSGLERQHDVLSAVRDSTLGHFPGVTIDLSFRKDYRNMKTVLDSVPFVTEYALEACKRAGIIPEIVPIRGGTDGSDLTFMGLPCPNIFTGGENFHSKLEWIPVDGMEKAVKVLLNLVQVWAEKSQ